ncbi:hypothetical protein PICMEDRAFT_51536 [Pichia membranifaciens NRRL Y-2026]|uniref:ABC transporter domain-containing protein n=1 Tax=Pichia membranifaciens NRRL Y-2026 TaxID=763406 RepID=A0A1E3NQB3_9ASCO|nr:hypothetical protein PICMEDRAFT_51536 [Pichia membranifaciens NRRL Y-2026]ODQ48271.1 hypothetical protein PICMEDRAFT_51536 [Pichia membranifaciens NRRL Y-2026]
MSSADLLLLLRARLRQINHFLLHELKTEERIRRRYATVLRYLNISPHAKPVWLFILTMLVIVGSVSSYHFVRLFSLLKPKYKHYFQKHPNLSNSFLNIKGALDIRSFTSSNTGTRVIHVPYKNKFIDVKLKTPNADKYERDKLIFKKFMREHEFNMSKSSTPTLPHRYQPAMRFQFFEKISIIWNLILIPKVFDKNSYLLASHIAFLIARTWLTLLVTKLDGQITKDLMSFNIKYFMRDMIYWFLFAVPASYINSSIKYLTRRISLNFRTNLVRYCHDLYMDSKLVYYKLQYNNNSIEEYKLNHQTFNQYVTEDIKRFCDSLTNLFTNVGKPTVDLIFFAIYLRDNIGNLGIFGILLNYFVTGLILKNYSPDFSKIWKVRSFFESIYYNYNLNLINNCEEISFYKGIGFERLKVEEIFNKLISHLNFEINQRFRFQLLEDYILKSIWPAFGYFFASLPILFDSLSSPVESLASSNIKSFTVNKRLILSMADAGSRLMYSIKDISRLNGLTDRIFTLLVNLHQVHDSNFKYGGMIGSGSANSFENGTIQKNFPGLRFEHIDIIPPSIKGPFAKPILKNLNFKILQGENLIIHGKNGCGKTSIIRIICELWPLFNNGLLSKPANSDILYVSQKQYFVNGSLRDQVIYPLNWKMCIEKGDDDSKIKSILKDVGLDYLVDRFGLDVDGKTDWDSLLSGGERQKLIFARVLYHNKKLVVLDEPTSAISYDYEDILFDLLKTRGFTLITISNRESLIKYHDYILELEKDDVEDSDGIFSKIDEDYLSKFETLDGEIEYLQNEISKINEMKKRKLELVDLLEGYE